MRACVYVYMCVYMASVSHLGNNYSQINRNRVLEIKKETQLQARSCGVRARVRARTRAHMHRVGKHLLTESSYNLHPPPK